MSLWASWAGIQPVVSWHDHSNFMKIFFKMESTVFCQNSKRYSSQIIFIKNIKSHLLVQSEVNLELRKIIVVVSIFPLCFLFPLKLKTLNTVLPFSILIDFGSPSLLEHVCFILRNRRHDVFQMHNCIEILFWNMLRCMTSPRIF